MEANENESTAAPNFWDAAKAVIRGKYIAIRPSERKKKVSNIRPNLTPTGARKRIANKAQNQQKNVNNKD